MLASSPAGSFGIKLIYPAHLYPPKPYFERSLGEGRPALMNVNRSVEGQRIASRIPIGHRALVYVTEVQLFVRAIEFIGTLRDGEEARKRHGIEPGEHGPFGIYLPIQMTARIDPWENGATRQSVCDLSGVQFMPAQGDSHVSLGKVDYDRMYASIPWTVESPVE